MECFILWVCVTQTLFCESAVPNRGLTMSNKIRSTGHEHFHFGFSLAPKCLFKFNFHWRKCCQQTKENFQPIGIGDFLLIPDCVRVVPFHFHTCLALHLHFPCCKTTKSELKPISKWKLFIWLVPCSLHSAWHEFACQRVSEKKSLGLTQMISQVTLLSLQCHWGVIGKNHNDHTKAENYQKQEEKYQVQSSHHCLPLLINILGLFLVIGLRFICLCLGTLLVCEGVMVDIQDLLHTVGNSACICIIVDKVSEKCQNVKARLTQNLIHFSQICEAVSFS